MDINKQRLLVKTKEHEREFLRTIKFRAWTWNRYTMLDWNFLLDTDGGFLSNVLSQSGFTTMQYTGLKDKNGKDIYEGDIMQYRTEIAKVRWAPGESGWVLEPLTVGTWILNNTTALSYEVIGNIYENPELLESQDRNE